MHIEGVSWGSTPDESVTLMLVGISDAGWLLQGLPRVGARMSRHLDIGSCKERSMHCARISRDKDPPFLFAETCNAGCLVQAFAGVGARMSRHSTLYLQATAG